ncbi:carboxypeptidase regulatory-like domain-containing protein [Paludisphaera mucosa]|uniref:Carboxypeptidase regulatory-like domain-containing protein n=1 Tax=Paludisphaera mucosa TaxID=3030827 RepID=A0ABT6FCN4_9BACT|nr:carboxypeptidase regulatory-like domain-containing protein [Paludisphaera mucosa]MDG3005341.1 carboxypeptidase regulatory-like domain-containing protein [Paludisphaera mucosa]
MNRRPTTRRLAPIAILMLTAGCGHPDDAVALVPVKGTITRNGEPLANASVSFMPDPGNPDQTPGGDASGPAGTYLARYKSRSGLAPGKYKVIVTPGLDAAGVLVDSNVQEAFKDDPIMLGEMQRSAASSSKAGRKAKKAAEFKAEFEAEVASDGATLDFDVKQAVSGKQTASR